MKTFKLVLGMAVTLLLPVAVMATPVTVINSGFDNIFIPGEGGSVKGSTEGWTAGGSGWAGIADPYSTSWYYLSGVPSGENTAYLYGGSSLSQDLAYTINADSTLSLTVDVGYYYGFRAYGSPTYSVQLWAGDTMFASAFAPLTAGKFTTLSIVSEARDHESLVGEQVTIKLAHFAGVGVGFDNVSFSNETHATSTAVPEPATLLLLGAGMLGLGIVRRRQRK